MKVCDVLNESKYKHDQLVVMHANGWMYFISDIPANIYRSQFYELCKLSGFEESWYKGNEYDNPIFYKLDEEDVREQLYMRRMQLPSYITSKTWKQFVQYVTLSEERDNDFED